MTENTRVEFSDELIDILGEIGTTDTVAFELLWMTDPKTEYHNGLGIKHLDVSEEDWCFSATLKNGNRYDMKIGKFIRYFFPGMFSEDDINAFCKAYNSIKDGEATDDGDIIDTSKVSMDPKDPRSAFLSLVTKTYPHGHEEEVFALLPPGLSKDSVGNYYKIIGATPKVMFTSHLDTADRAQKETQLYSIKENGEEYVITDGSSILGADDKAGVAVMLYMMAHSIPGLYYFFIGEERGGIGSRALAKIFGEVAHLKGITRCVSFDRRNYHSVITSQLGSRCCSDEFAAALCKEYNKNGLSLSPDATGIYTDSASFMEDIPECTNVSVGYFDEHTGGEYQNITYLEKLCEASLKVDWAALPVHRKIGLDDTVIKKNEKLISALKKASYMLDHKIVCDEGKTYFRIDLEAAYIDDAHDCLELVLRVLQSFKRGTDVVLENTHIKIELN